MSALAGKRALVTRAAEDQDELAAILRGRGAEPVALPCIEFAEPLDLAALDGALRPIRSGSPPDFLVLASPHAADRFFDGAQVRCGARLRWLRVGRHRERQLRLGVRGHDVDGLKVRHSNPP